MKDPCVTIFFTAIPLARILCAVMEGTYNHPNYEKYIKEQREIEGNMRFKEIYQGRRNDEEEEERLKELADDLGDQEYLNEPLVA